MVWKQLIIISSLAATAATVAPSQPIVMQTKPASRPKVTYAYSIVDLRTIKVSVKAFARATQITAVPASLACKGVAITGGFSRQAANGLKPQGLVRTESRVISGLATWADGGVLWVNGADVRITRIAAWRSSPANSGMALQARPLLVVDGKVDEPLNDRRRWNRVAVGTMRDGKVVLIGAFTPHNNGVTLREFAQDAMAILGPDLVSLLNMDGGPSAFLTSPDVQLFPSQGVVTTYICAEAK